MSDTQSIEWVQVEDWHTLKPNQLVKATGAGGTILAIVYTVHHEAISIIPEGVCEVVSMRPHIWSLFIEKPKVQLPTEPGWYTDGNGVLWHCNGLMWRIERGGYVLPGHIINPAMPYTLLRPVAEVAAEVLADVRAELLQRFPNYLQEGGSNLDRAISRAAAKWATN